MADSKSEKEYRDCFNKRSKEKSDCLNKLSAEQREFVSAITRSQCRLSASKLLTEFYMGLRSGEFTPSEYFKNELSGLFDGYIFPRHKESFLWAVDNVTRWVYGVSYCRRSFRTADYSVYLRTIGQIMYIYSGYQDFDVCDLLTLNLPETEREYAARHNYDYLLVYELDHGNEKAEQIVTDIINGEGQHNIDGGIIRDIVRSENKKMHELLCRLLLVARLQEGLRQAICESADMGSASAFLSILKVIEENNLLRFSSVKRAVGVWTGLLNPEEKDIDRISEKTLRLIIELIEDESARARLLNSEDSMEIYLSLWAYSFYEVRDAAEKVSELSKGGTHHQILTAGYFAAALDNKRLSHELSKPVIMEHSHEADILAVFLSYFIGREEIAGFRYDNFSAFVVGEMITPVGERKLKIPSPRMEVFFSDTEQAERYFALLLEIYKDIPKKSVEFSPCIFPWYSVSLKKSDVVDRLCFIAYLLHDDEKIDLCTGLICDSEDRATLYAMLLNNPQTAVQRAALTEALGDRETYARETAAKLIENVTLEAENYRQIEDMLRYKAADIRSTLIGLLYRQEDDALYSSCERLLSDKKEEKRTAGLDIILRLSQDEGRQELFSRCRSLAVATDKTTAKEKILIDEINKDSTVDTTSELYSEAADYTPTVNQRTLAAAEKVFYTYFPKKGVIGKLFDGKNDFQIVIEKLDALIGEHIDDEFVHGYSGETVTIGCHTGAFLTRYEGEEKADIPFRDLWEDFYQKEIKSPQLLYRAFVARLAEDGKSDYEKVCNAVIAQLIGEEFTVRINMKYGAVLFRVLEYLHDIHGVHEDEYMISFYTAYRLGVIYDSMMFDCEFHDYRGVAQQGKFNILDFIQLDTLLKSGIHSRDNKKFADIFPLLYILQMKSEPTDKMYNRLQFGVSSCASRTGLNARAYIRAGYLGVISEGFMYKTLFEGKSTDRWGIAYLGSALEEMSIIYSVMREYNSPVSAKSTRGMWRVRSVFENVTGKSTPAELTEEDKKFVAYCEKVYLNLSKTVLSTELKRGDSETRYSKAAISLTRIYGAEYFVAILTALGNETLERSSYYYYYYRERDVSKKQSLSHLLAVCLPLPDDNADTLRQCLKGSGISEKRLIEAALYSPEWINIVGEYLGWEGFISACYYFMAHMNEQFDDKRKAVIAKYTPLTADELNSGAFDISWFRAAYEEIGQKRFDMIYDAAKYISDGTKHSRARKYADAALGKMNVEDTEKVISDKRNKDLLMAYALIPIADESDTCRRYLFLQKFLKESKKFGSQRSASEKKAVETAMQNLSINAGYSDTMRLTLRMETKLIDDSKELFTERVIDDMLFVSMSVDEGGKPEIICKKDGDVLKSVPAKYKKNEHIIRLTETKKKLTEQYRRTRAMFEQAMEDGTEFTADELEILQKNPVVYPMIKNLVFIFGDKSGFIRENILTDYSGNAVELSAEDMLRPAHPFDLYSMGNWAGYQKFLFENKIIQPFKQVFRELYVKTPEEAEMKHSLRYAGNQIQPAKTLACLKTRRWVADVEDGLQKVYYKENVIARIYVLADWFMPSDIESPTIEWVEFSDRRSGREIPIKDVPDIIFSEVMRDVDLAVSVAHAGGVDPETSHSTIEMRAALLEFTLPLFKIGNVEIKGSHAHIHGSRADYSVHLGSGVVHIKGGAMLYVLPVHSQHRGKLFLPFADDDPKTAEITTKVLFFAEDSKIKDPSILSQING